jgi:hypothetical protein
VVDGIKRGVREYLAHRVRYKWVALGLIFLALVSAVLGVEHAWHLATGVALEAGVSFVLHAAFVAE